MEANEVHTPNDREKQLQLIIEAIQARDYRRAESLSMKLLHEDPLCQQAWVHLGEALMRQKQGEMARRVFERAWLLDPLAAWAIPVFAELNRITSGIIDEEIEQLLQVPHVTVTAAILVHNEERSIARCLSSIVDAVDEVLLINCESTDRTVQIAREFIEKIPLRIVDTRWDNDFSALRNFGLSHIRTDWVLWVDGDEALHPDDRSKVREVAAIHTSAQTGYILNLWNQNKIDDLVEHTYDNSRMFPTNHSLHYIGRVHEQIVPKNTVKGSHYPHQRVRIRLLHDGYDPTIVASKNKLERNLRLLQMMVDEQPNDAGAWFFFGRDTIMTGDLELAVERLQQAAKIGYNLPHFTRMAHTYVLLAQIYFEQKKYELAVESCKNALKYDNNYPDALYYLAKATMEQSLTGMQEAKSLLDRIKRTGHLYRGHAPADRSILHWKADLALADFYRLTGQLSEANQLYARIFPRTDHPRPVEAQLNWIAKQRDSLNRQFAPSAGNKDNGNN